jgi:hypothetical protein
MEYGCKILYGPVPREVYYEVPRRRGFLGVGGRDARTSHGDLCTSAFPRCPRRGSWIAAGWDSWGLLRKRYASRERG